MKVPSCVIEALDADLPPITMLEGAPSSAIVLEYSADGHVAVKREDVAPADLESSLRGIYAERRDKTLFIAGSHRRSPTPGSAILRRRSSVQSPPLQPISSIPPNERED